MLLIVFAFLAGLVTILAPCILPVLPIILAGGTVAGRQRVWGIVVGVTLSFSSLTLLLSWLVRHAGWSPNLGRDLGIGLLIIFGVLILTPRWLDQFEGWMSSITQRFVPSHQVRGW